MTLDEIIRKVADEMGLPFDVCRRAYISSWEFIKMKAEELPLSTDFPIEQFKTLRPNFNLPSLGKLYITEETFEHARRKYLMMMRYKEERNAEDN